MKLTTISDVGLANGLIVFVFVLFAVAVGRHYRESLAFSVVCIVSMFVRPSMPNRGYRTGSNHARGL